MVVDSNFRIEQQLVSVIETISKLESYKSKSQKASNSSKAVEWVYTIGGIKKIYIDLHVEQTFSNCYP